MPREPIAAINEFFNEKKTKKARFLDAVATWGARPSPPPPISPKAKQIILIRNKNKAINKRPSDKIREMELPSSHFNAGAPPVTDLIHQRIVYLKGR